MNPNASEEIVHTAMQTTGKGILMVVLVVLAILFVIALARMFKSVRIVLAMTAFYVVAVAVILSFRLPNVTTDVIAFVVMGIFVVLTVCWIRSMLKRDRRKQREKAEAEIVMQKYGGRIISRGKLPKDLEDAQDLWEDR